MLRRESFFDEVLEGIHDALDELKVFEVKKFREVYKRFLI